MRSSVPKQQISEQESIGLHEIKRIFGGRNKRSHWEKHRTNYNKLVIITSKLVSTRCARVNRLLLCKHHPPVIFSPTFVQKCMHVGGNIPFQPQNLHKISAVSFFLLPYACHFFLRRHLRQHACISTQKQERKSQAGGVYTAGYNLLACTPSTH